MKKLFLLCLVPFVLHAADFSDDFSGYEIGMDLEDSLYWHGASDTSLFEVISYSGSNAVQSSFEGETFIGYGCVGSGVVADGGVGMDYRFTGTECMFAVLIRVDDSIFQGYAGGLYCSSYSPIGGYFIAFIDESGEYTTMVEEYTLNATPDTWHTLVLEATGADPVTLTLTDNGSEVATVQDTTYLLPMGLTGFGCAYENAAPTFIADNFVVDDYADGPITVQESSFGRIKAMFE